MKRLMPIMRGRARVEPKRPQVVVAFLTQALITRQMAEAE